MTLAVRRRAVCALALLALLCGPVCGATKEEAATNVKVSVEVSCPNAEKKLGWRVAGDTSWTQCPQTVEESLLPTAITAAASGDDGGPTCIWAHSLYLASRPNSKCTPPSPAKSSNVVALTMKCVPVPNSALHNLSKSKTITATAAETALSAPGDCVLLTTTPSGAEVTPERPAPGVPSPPQQQPADAAAASPAAQTSQGDPTRNEGTTPPAEGPGSAAERGSRGPSAGDPRETTTPSVDTAASPSAAAGRTADGTTTTTTTTRSQSAGSHAKSSADGSATSTPFVRAPLLLLLTAALACAAA
ncbi:mucin-like glycoprotein [Trypanosoma conorhini]|uniref:Mucin-like glycoprotein n=1 Tax=Trypanosoma conorhini TaxID=83891 RepID=A0A3R7JPX6_9TRYP|nr:mucin-like glycoprotein [Trypanosoma conorhini]RNE94955.1 mucin-like glycoprotein [Trypanosoma conorhini]